MVAPRLDESMVQTRADDLTFDDVYETNFAFVWRSARRLGMPDAALEDVTQEIFLVVHRQLSGFEGRSTLRSWLFSIVVRVVRRQRTALLKKHPHSVRAEAETDVEGLYDARCQGPHELAAKQEAGRVLSLFLESLEDKQREVFILAELEQMSAPEIATALRTNLNTIYSRLRLARKAFATAIARHRARDTARAQ